MKILRPHTLEPLLAMSSNLLDKTCNRRITTAIRKYKKKGTGRKNLTRQSLA